MPSLTQLRPSASPISIPLSLSSYFFFSFSFSSSSFFLSLSASFSYSLPFTSLHFFSSTAPSSSLMPSGSKFSPYELLELSEELSSLSLGQFEDTGSPKTSLISYFTKSIFLLRQSSLCQFSTLLESLLLSIIYTYINQTQNQYRTSPKPTPEGRITETSHQFSSRLPPEILGLNYKLKNTLIPMPGPKDEAKNQMEEILRKIQEESSEAKRAEAMRILQSGETSAGRATSWFGEIKRRWLMRYEERKMLLVRQARVTENKHLALISLFFIGAVWMSWAIEDKYDKLRRRANGSKGQKERMAEIQNQYITRMLSKSQFQPVPIDEEQIDPENYIYQSADIEFDTKADLMEVLENERKVLETEDQPQDI